MRLVFITAFTRLMKKKSRNLAANAVRCPTVTESIISARKLPIKYLKRYITITSRIVHES